MTEATKVQTTDLPFPKWGDEDPFVDPEMASTNLFWTFGKEQKVGFQTTVRGNLPETAIKAHLGTAVRAAMEIVAIGGTLRMIGQDPIVTSPLTVKNEGAPAASAPAAGAGHPAPMPGGSREVPGVSTAPKPQPPMPESVPAGTGATDGMFDAATLTCETKEGNQYWRVKGGAYSKFGVRIWPEVLAEHFDLGQLDPTQSYNLTGFQAFFVNNDQGKPQKVIRLVKRA